MFFIEFMKYLNYIMGKHNTIAGFLRIVIAIFSLLITEFCKNCEGDSFKKGHNAGFSFYAKSSWPTIHANSRNSDFAMVNGSSDLTPAFHILDNHGIGAGATIGPEGNLYVGAGLGDIGSFKRNCHLFAFDGDTGEMLWCKNSLNDHLVTSSPLIDIDGNIFIGDNESMASFTSNGKPRWREDIIGFPISSQFTPDGRVIFITHIGRIYVMDRNTGELVVPVYELVPGQDYDARFKDYQECLFGLLGSACFSANTLAIDLESGRFFFTLLKPSESEGIVAGFRYIGGRSPTVIPLWNNSTLVGGSASSPVISNNGKRIYLADYSNNIVALSALTGKVIWKLDIGFVPLGSLSVSDSGRIIPAGNLNSDTIAITDMGDHAEVLWQRPDIHSRSIAAQTENDIAYVVAAKNGSLAGLDLWVLNAETGETLDFEPISDVAQITVGTSISSNGYVYIPTISGGIYGFKPVE